MYAPSHRVEAWLCGADEAMASAVAARIVAVDAVDAVHVPPRCRDLPADASLVILVPGTERAIGAMLGTVRSLAPRAVVVVALATVALSELEALLMHGADAVVDLDADDRSLAHGLRAAVRDGAYVPHEYQADVVAGLARHRRGDAEAHQRIARLTPKEREIFDLLIAGDDRAAIAARFGGPAWRVRARIERAKAKLGVASQREAVALFRRYPVARIDVEDRAFDPDT